MTVRLVIASYNIHGGVGLDRRFVPRRIADVLAELAADIVALQEVESRATGFDMLGYLRDATGYAAVAGPTLVRADGDFGNALLTRLPIRRVRLIDLNVDRREPRGAIDARLEADGMPLRVVATHLGLRPAERREQVQRLLIELRGATDAPTILAGDLNEWFLWGRPLRWLHGHFGETPARATFPSSLPLFALDRLWTAPADALRGVRAHASRLARHASDHLPLVAELEF